MELHLEAFTFQQAWEKWAKDFRCLVVALQEQGLGEERLKLVVEYTTEINMDEEPFNDAWTALAEPLQEFAAVLKERNLLDERLDLAVTYWSRSRESCLDKKVKRACKRLGLCSGSFTVQPAGNSWSFPGVTLHRHLSCIRTRRPRTTPTVPFDYASFTRGNSWL